MTFRHTLLTAGLLALAVSAASAAPTIKLVRVGAAQGAVAEVQIMAVPDGGQGMNTAVIALKFDSNKAAIAATGATTAGTGWDSPVYSIAGDTVTLATTTSDAADVTTAAVIAKLKVTNNSPTGSLIETIGGGTIASASFDQWDIPAGLKAAIVTGKVRNLAPIPGSPAVGPGGMVAVGAGTKLYLLNPDTTDAAGWTDGKEVGGAVTGRPAFGVLNGAAVVAAGTDNGNLAVFALDGTQVSNGPVAGVTGIPTAPAIDPVSGKVVLAAQAAAGPVLIGANTINLGTGTITGSPLVVSGAIIAGTSAEILYARIDGSGAITPQSATALGEAVGSPVADRAGSAIAAAASGKVYKINLVTGDAGSPIADAAGEAPLSAPFFNYGTGEALFGGAHGKVVSVKAADGAMTLSPPLSAAALVTPLGIGSKIIAADVEGEVGVPGAETQKLAGVIPGAICATGPTAADSVVVATADGSVVVIAMP